MGNSILDQSEVTTNAQSTRLIRLAKSFAIPVLFLAGYFVSRALNINPQIEMEGVSDLIRDLFLMFGCSIAYFLYLFQISLPNKNSPFVANHFWLFSSLLLLFILFDDIFMLHEQVGEFLDSSDKVLLIINGIFLALLLFVYRNRLVRNFWIFIAAFGALSVAAILLDNTGTYWNVAGREIDLEQILEVFALLAISSAFTAQAIQELHMNFKESLT